MSISHRKTKRLDLSECQQLIFPSRIYNRTFLAALPHFWETMLCERAMHSQVVESLAPHSPGRIVGFGASVFISDKFIRDFKRHHEPGLAQYIMQAHLDKELSVLDSPRIAEANASIGLTLVTFSRGWSHQLHPSEWFTVRDHFCRSFLHEHIGYHIKEILSEGVQEELKPAFAMGFRLRDNYAAYYCKHPSIPQHERLYLCGITHEEAVHSDIITPAVSLFATVLPRLGLSLRDQELLDHALCGKGDEELAEDLHISISAVKKRWLAIYDQVLCQVPEIIPDSRETGTRGIEKRRHLLAYVRSHPEELRPYKTRDHFVRTEIQGSESLSSVRSRNGHFGLSDIHRTKIPHSLQ